MSPHHPTAHIESLYIVDDPTDFYTSPADELVYSLEPNGIVGDDRYRANTRLADVRAPAYNKKEDEVLNRQSVSFVSAEDLDYIANELSLDPFALIYQETERSVRGVSDDLDETLVDLRRFEDPGRIVRKFLARCMGANIVLANFTGTDEVSDFRSLAAGTDFGPYDPAVKKFTDATIMTTRANGPCIHPGKKIQEGYPNAVEDLAKRFVVAAQGRRGFVGMVAKAGTMSVGQSVAFIPYGER